jgi:hypothetical protein
MAQPQGGSLQGETPGAGGTPAMDERTEKVVRECRSALLTTCLMTFLPDALLKLVRSQFPEEMKPMSLDDAVDLLTWYVPDRPVTEAEGAHPASAYAWRSHQMATEFLTEAQFLRGRKGVSEHLAKLLEKGTGTRTDSGLGTGRTVKEVQALLYPKDEEGGPPPALRVARTAFGLPEVKLSMDSDGGVRLAAMPLMPRPLLDFDPETLTTTVTVYAITTLELEELQSLLDPRSWVNSPFWEKAELVDLPEDEENLASDAQEPGMGPWPSYFFEQVHWNLNAAEVYELSTHLRINYSFNRKKAPKDIDMRFYLHESLGCSLPFIPDAAGVDVDNGFLMARPTQAIITQPGSPDAQEAVYFVATQKKLRFTDLLADQPVTSSILGKGLLNLLMPALLSLWMRELVSGIYTREQVVRLRGPQPAAGTRCSL